MKTLKQFLTESCDKKCCQDTIEKVAPKFLAAVKQFCRDKNVENGVDELIAAWTNQEAYDSMDKVFTPTDCREFEDKYLKDVSDEELDKLSNLDCK